MKKLMEIVTESLEVDASVVSEDLVFREHASWNSLTALSLITAIEDELGIMLGDTDIRAVKTVKELSDLVAMRTNGA